MCKVKKLNLILVVVIKCHEKVKQKRNALSLAYPALL